LFVIWRLGFEISSESVIWILGLLRIEWVKLYLLEHTNKNLKAEIFFVTKTISSFLYHSDLIIQPFNKTLGWSQ